MKDDDDIVAVVECPRCGEEVLLEIDRDNPIEVDEFGNATDYGPGEGQCCGLVFLVQPDGTVESFDVRAD